MDGLGAGWDLSMVESGWFDALRFFHCLCCGGLQNCIPQIKEEQIGVEWSERDAGWLVIVVRAIIAKSVV